MLSQILSVSEDLRIGDSKEAPREERSGELLIAMRRSLHGEAIGVCGGDALLAGLKIGEVREAGR